MDKSKILEKMREIAIRENINIIKNKLGDIETKLDYDNLIKTDKVQDVKYLGKIQMNKEIGGNQVKTFENIFLIIEQMEVDTPDGKQIMRLNKYVTENMETIAVSRTDGMYDMPIVTSEYLEQKEFLEEQIEQLDIDDPVLDLNNMEEKRIEEIAEVLGISPEDIKTMDEIDLNQEISANGIYKPKAKEQEQKTITNEQFESIQLREETSLNQEIKGETLGDKLGLEKEGIEDADKLVRVSASGLNKYLDESITQQDAFVVTRKKGKPPVVLGDNILEPDSRAGTNPRGDDNLTINNDGTTTREAVTSSYRIVNGDGNEYLRTGYDEITGKEIKYSMYSPQEDRYVDVELETQKTSFQDNDVRQFMKEERVATKDREAEMIEERYRQHEQMGEEEVEVEDVDNDKNNNTHEHGDGEVTNETLEERSMIVEPDDYIPNTNITWEQLASKCGYRGEDRIKRAYERFEKAYNDNPDKTNKEIIEEIEEEENRDYRGGLREM